MTAVTLPRSVPSSQGVDAAPIIGFLDAVDASGIDLHSLMVLRHGHVVAEGWWAPYRPELVHLLYSLSKSYTSTAIGMAAAEGLLSIEDPVVSFFPDKVPEDVSPFVTGMKVRHLLSMASGHAVDTVSRLRDGGPDWVRTFLSIPPDKEPGTLFCYNQGCTYTLSAIITKLTGRRLVDYLQPRLFDPLGIDQAVWQQSDEGVDLGFSGFHAATESIAKLGQLHLHNGRWGDRQLLPEAYSLEAHRMQVDNSSFSENLDWQQGYGFQFWRCTHDAFRGDGAFGQFCVILPEVDAVVACTAQTTEMQAELNLIWEHLLPALSGGGGGQSGGDPAADAALLERLGRLSTPTIAGGAGGPGTEVTFARLGESSGPAAAITAIRVAPSGAGSRLTVVADGADQVFDLRPGEWATGALPGMHALIPIVAVTGGWTSRDRFEADVVLVTTPHRLQLRATIGDRPGVEVGWQVEPL